MVRYNNININITSSDAYDVRVNYAGSDEVHLDFKDYLDKQVRVTFNTVAAFLFGKIEEGSFGRDDQIYEVIESEWLAKQLSDLSDTEREKYSHFMFCFNTYKKAFHVICNRKFDFTKDE